MSCIVCVCVTTEYLLSLQWLILHVRGWRLFQEQKSHNEGLSKEEAENYDCVSFLSPQGVLHKLPIWLIATQRNPTPSMLLPALWSQKQAKQSHSSLQPLKKLGVSRGWEPKIYLPFQVSQNLSPLFLSLYMFKSVLVSVMMTKSNSFSKNNKILKTCPVFNPHCE